VCCVGCYYHLCVFFFWLFIRDCYRFVVSLLCICMCLGICADRCQAGLVCVFGGVNDLVLILFI